MRTHGMAHTTEYNIWISMRDRCCNCKDEHFPDYGGRGIRVCERWRKFENFYADMGPRPSTGHSIERKDNDGNYEPSNCVWATKKEQARNKRTTVRITFDGQTRPLAEWAEFLGLNYDLLRQRIYRDKLPPELAFRPEKLNNEIVYGERTGSHKLTLSQVIELKRRRRAGERAKDLSAEFGVSTAQIYNIMIGKHWPDAAA